MSASMMSFVYISIRRRTENNQIALIYISIRRRTENNQIALIIIWPIWNSHFLRLLFIFEAAIFLEKIWTKNKLTWTRPP